VRNAVNLVKSLNAVLDKLGELHSLFDRVRNTLDHNGVVGLAAFLTGKKVMGTLKVAADSDATLYAQFV